MILLGVAAASAPYAVRGTPWYSPNKPHAWTEASCAGVGSSAMTMATESSWPRNGSGSSAIASSRAASNGSTTSTMSIAIWWPRPTDHARYSSDVCAIQMTGAVFLGPGRPLSIERLWLDPPGPGEVRVRMVASGVCHSDLHVVDGDWVRPTDVVLGHEGAGIVEALGAGVTTSVIGDLVVLVWTAPCGTCPACRRAEPWLCATPRGGGHRRDADQVRVHRA